MNSNPITNRDFNGPIANLIKIMNAYRDNENVKDVINVLRRPEKDVLNEINAGCTSQEDRVMQERKLEEEKDERANDFGIGM